MAYNRQHYKGALAVLTCKFLITEYEIYHF